MKLSQFSIQFEDAITKQAYLTFLNSALLILLQYFSGSSRMDYFDGLYVRVRFQQPVGYFRLILIQILLFSYFIYQQFSIRLSCFPFKLYFRFIMKRVQNEIIKSVIQQPMIVWIVLSLFYLASAQMAMIWSTPRSGFQAKTVSLIINGYLPSSPKYTAFTFANPFTVTPEVCLALSSLKNIENDLTIYQEAVTRTLTSFNHKLSVVDSAKSVQILKISYAAIDLSKFNYFYPHSIRVQLNKLSLSSNPDTQIFQVNYLNPLTNNNTFEISVMISGFNIRTSSASTVGVEAQLFDSNSYILLVKCNHGLLIHIQVIRIMIDKTIEAAQTTQLHLLSLNSGTVTHFKSKDSIYTPYQINFYTEAFFYGVMYFQQKFESQVNNSIYNTVTPSVNLKTGCIVFMERICTSGSLFQETTLTCYPANSPRMYQINIQTCGFCHQACYTCTGPKFEDCSQYLSQQARNISNKIQCKAEYSTHNITNHCRSCSSFVSNCNQCLYDGNCTSCVNSCVLVNQTYCDCSSLCTSDLEFISPHSRLCQCKPQYYRMQNGTCGKCLDGCYTCSGSSSSCTSCIDGYQLVLDSCVNFYHTTYIIDYKLGQQSSRTRCIQQSASGCLEYCPSSSFSFNNKCYIYECLSGYFPFVEIYSNSKMCQICPLPCIECDNSIVCKKCIEGGYFMNSTGACVGCIQGCKSCSDSSSCNTCSTGYRLSSIGLCQQILPSIPLACEIGCQTCKISSYCQKCSEGYYRFKNSNQCTKCEGVGLTLTNYKIDQYGMAKLWCEDVCGDGIVIINACDDGNLLSGDGCNSNCQIEQGFSCEYLATSKRSLCLKEDYTMSCRFSKNITNNELNITIEWVGSPIYFQHKCPSPLTVTNSYIKSNSSTYRVSYSQTAQNQTCVFSVADSISLSPVSCNITTFPSSLYVSQDNPVLAYAQFGFSFAVKPMAYCVWVLSAIGIDPFSAIINHSFIYLYLLSLYDFKNQPPNVYNIFNSLKIFGFDFIGKDYNSEVLQDGNNFLQPSINVLIYFAAVVAFNQIVVRILKIETLFPDCQVRIFSNIQNSRFVTYICVCFSMLPICLLYTSELFMNLQDDIVAVAIGTAHVFCFIACNIIMVCISSKVTQTKAHIKFIYLIIIWQQLSLLQGFSLLSSLQQRSSQFKATNAIFIALFIFFIYALADSSIQTPNMSKDSMQLSQELENYGHKTFAKDCWTSGKQTVRKINMIIQFVSFLSICGLRIIFLEQKIFNLKEKHQIIGTLITLIFLLGNLTFGIIFYLISTIFSIGIFFKTQSKPKSRQSEIGSKANLRDQPSLSQFSRQIN